MIAGIRITRSPFGRKSAQRRLSRPIEVRITFAALRPGAPITLSVNGIQQDELDKVTATISEMGITLPVALDQSEILWDSYWVRFLPTSFFIDETGVIRYIQLGSLTEENLRIKLEELISDQL